MPARAQPAPARRTPPTYSNRPSRHPPSPPQPTPGARAQANATETPRQQAIKQLAEALPQARDSKDLKVEFMSLDDPTLSKFAELRGGQRQVRLARGAAVWDALAGAGRGARGAWRT